MLLKLLHGRDQMRDEEKTAFRQFPSALIFENQRCVLGFLLLRFQRREVSCARRSVAPSGRPRPAELPAQVPRRARLQGQRGSCLLPFPLRSALFLFFSCAVAMTEYGNMFMNLLRQSQPCDKAISL